MTESANSSQETTDLDDKLVAKQLDSFNEYFEKSKPTPVAFLSVCGGLFAATALSAIFLGRSKAMQLAFKAFGFATLGCISVFGTGAIGLKYYLNSIGVHTVPEFGAFVSKKFEAYITPLHKRPTFDPELDAKYSKFENWDTSLFSDSPKDEETPKS
ncbi:hypothetical protein BB560_000668 [Smittium megazygosporum]|uniref:Transmembrane protein 242 n=1 Tax=Smittium megazygosporum TaxID=133381 RepID=A0A2T9ZJP5_9FUNG|nr:hypothetical protein BB560_000668 [Smittium megazygosporum]